MVVSPSGALSSSGFALGVDNHVGNPTGMSYLYIVLLSTASHCSIITTLCYSDIVKIVREKGESENITFSTTQRSALIDYPFTFGSQFRIVCMAC